MLNPMMNSMMTFPSNPPQNSKKARQSLAFLLMVAAM